MKELGPTKRILGMEISREKKNKILHLSQSSYISKVLKRFKTSKRFQKGMDHLKTTSTLIG